MENQFDLSFDWDGTLTSSDGPIGQDNGAEIDLTPLKLALERGLTVAVMTCNDPIYVAEVLRQQGIRSAADRNFSCKTPQAWAGNAVIVTGRKVLSARYVDDRNITWRFGDDPELIFEGI